jgi:integrase
MAWLYKRPGSQKWWIGWRANNRQFLQSTGTTDRAEASKRLAEYEAQAAAAAANKLNAAIFASLTGQTTTRRTLQAEIVDWLKECTGTTAKGTLARYRGIMEDFSSFVKATATGPMLSEIDANTIRAYLNDKLTRAAVSTVNLEKKILSSFFLRAVDHGFISKNPVALVKKFKASGDEVERRNLTLGEINAAYSKAKDEFWRYMIIGGFYSGLREGDLITLDWRKVDWQKTALKLTAKKTGKPVLVPIAPRFALELKAIWNGRGKPTSGPVFPQQSARYKKRGASPFSRQFYKILSDCKLVEKRVKDETKNGQAARRTINEVTFHSLRHSFITALNSAGGSNLIAKELAGHSSDIVNAAYTHLDYELIKKAVAALPEVAS